MKNSLDIKLLLNAFNKITRDGVKKGESYVLNQVMAWTDFDGYTCFLQHQDVKVSLFFHNKYHVEAPNEGAVEGFERLLSKIIGSN